jgi:hypothetical protein
MRRTKPPAIQTNTTIAGDVASRLKLASGLGLQYGGKRDVYEALGYPKDSELNFAKYWFRYDRQDIAKAVIDKPVNKTWNGPISVSEPDQEEEETQLQKKFKEWEKRLKLTSKLSRLDKLTRVGYYGVLLLGFNDVQKDEDFMRPVQKSGNLKLLYVKPFDSYSASIHTYTNDPSNPRFGMPELYNIELHHPSSNATTQIQVHYSRVIHVVEDAVTSEIYGTPVLKAVYNRLMDLEKLVGGDAEMFWRGARPGYAANVNDEYSMDNETYEDVKGQIAEFNHDLRRILTLKGIDLQSLAQQIADPSGHIDAQLTMVSVVTEIPKRILMGSERGELSSKQDKDEWAAFIKGRRENHAEPNILRPFIDRMIELGLVDADPDYMVEWEDLFAPSEKEKAEVGNTRAAAIKAYTVNPAAQSIIPPKAFFKTMLGLSDDQIEMIEQYMNEEIEEEQQEIEGTEPNEGE